MTQHGKVEYVLLPSRRNSAILRTNKRHVHTSRLRNIFQDLVRRRNDCIRIMLYKLDARIRNVVAHRFREGNKQADDAKRHAMRPIKG
jgi:hypothetical protein